MPRLISLFDVEPIFEPLARGQLILTPNQRLASRICAAYVIACAEQGQPVVDRPAVYSLNNWIDRCWQHLLIIASPLALGARPLSSTQEHALWEQIVSSSDLGAALLRPSATAQQAASAYRILVDWRQEFTVDTNTIDYQSMHNPSINALRDDFARDEDSAVLLGWIDQFEVNCEANHWLPSARISEQVLKAFDKGILTSIGEILGIGFEDIPPLQQALIKSAGQFQRYSATKAADSITVLECDSAKQELTAAAVWAKQVLKNDSAATVAIVIPNLTQQRQTIQRVLQEVFDPAYNAPLNDQGEASTRRNLPFNFSAGYPLLDAPIISAALNSLSLSLPLLDIETLEAVCQSPFYSLDDTDGEALACLIKLLYEQRDTRLTSTCFRQLATKVADSVFQSQGWHFAETLQKQANLSRAASIGKARSAEQWRELFHSLITAMGWPGKRRLDSIEFQQVTQWQQALTEFVALDRVSQPLSFNAAVSQLRRIVSRRIFQPQTPDSSLQVLGTLEAAGLQFSHCWLMSMSEQQWPPAPSPHPLLPFSLQRDQRMPHANAERELDYAKNLTQRFIHSSRHLVVSSAQLIDDSPTSISRLFNQYPRKTLTELLGRPLEALIPLTEIRRRHVESQRLEVFDAGKAPALTREEPIKGGASLFANQSACPFKAFASHRLGLRALPEPELGLSAADRGSLLHRALELLWEKLKNQTALLALEGNEQDKLCYEVSEYTVTEICQRQPSRLGTRYKSLESVRLLNLLMACFTV